MYSLSHLPKNLMREDVCQRKNKLSTYLILNTQISHLKRHKVYPQHTAENKYAWLSTGDKLMIKNACIVFNCVQSVLSNSRFNQYTHIASRFKNKENAYNDRNL